MNEFWPLIVTVIVSVTPSIISLISSRRKNAADITRMYQEIALKQAQETLRLEDCQGKLEMHVAELERALVNKDNKIAELERKTSSQEQRIVDMMVEAERNEDYIQVLTGYVDQLVAIMQTAGLKPPVKPRRDNHA